MKAIMYPLAFRCDRAGCDRPGTHRVASGEGAGIVDHGTFCRIDAMQKVDEINTGRPVLPLKEYRGN